MSPCECPGYHKWSGQSSNRPHNSPAHLSRLESPLDGSIVCLKKKKKLIIRAIFFYLLKKKVNFLSKLAQILTIFDLLKIINYYLFSYVVRNGNIHYQSNSFWCFRLENVRQVLDENSILHHTHFWGHPVRNKLLIEPCSTLSAPSMACSAVLRPLVFTSTTESGYAHLDHRLLSTPESIEHRILRSRKSGKATNQSLSSCAEFPFVSRPPLVLHNLWTNMPRLMCLPITKV